MTRADTCRRESLVVLNVQVRRPSLLLLRHAPTSNRVLNASLKPAFVHQRSLFNVLLLRRLPVGRREQAIDAVIDVHVVFRVRVQHLLRWLGLLRLFSFRAYFGPFLLLLLVFTDHLLHLLHDCAELHRLDSLRRFFYLFLKVFLLGLSFLLDRD